MRKNVPSKRIVSSEEYVVSLRFDDLDDLLTRSFRGEAAEELPTPSKRQRVPSRAAIESKESME